MVATTAAAVAAASVGGGPAAEAAAPRQAGTIVYTSTAPRTATGLAASFEFQNPENPSLKPHAVATLIMHGPAGATIDTTVPAQCHASDAELMIEGPAACPPDSKVVSGLVVADTGGGAGPFPRYPETTTSGFNQQDAILGVGESKDLPAIRHVDHTKISGNTTTTDFPTIPGLPPPDPYTPFKSMHILIPPYVRAGRAYVRTPPTCPAAGYWTFRAEFIYRDGVTQSIDSHSPCQPARARHRRHTRPRRHRPHHGRHRH